MVEIALYVAVGLVIGVLLSPRGPDVQAITRELAQIRSQTDRAASNLGRIARFLEDYRVFLSRGEWPADFGGISISTYVWRPLTIDPNTTKEEKCTFTPPQEAKSE